MHNNNNLTFSVQWHITTNCNNNCRHCYMYDEKTFADERKNTLSDEQLIRVLDDLTGFERKYGVRFSTFNLSGGDPVSRPGWDGFVKTLRDRGKRVTILGNPELLSAENISKLKSLGVSRYQMSLDGLENDHDDFRSPGSFKRTVAKISELEEAGIPCQIMFTYYPENRKHLFPLIEFLSENTPLSSFSFDIGCSAGNAENLSTDFSREEIKDVLERYLRLKESLINSGKKLLLREKSHFLRLFRFPAAPEDLKTFKAFPVAEGCHAAWSSVAILSDGRLMACRRMPVTSGKMPEQSFEELFLGDPFFRKLRRRTFYKGCFDCAYYQYCRGCPAYCEGETGDPFAVNPVCIKELLDDTGKVTATYPDPPLDVSFGEEMDFVKSAFHYNPEKFFERLKGNPVLRNALFRLADDREESQKYINSPTSYAGEQGFDLDAYDLLLLRHFLNWVVSDGLLVKKDTAPGIRQYINWLKYYHIRQN